MLSRVGELVDTSDEYVVYEDWTGTTPAGLLFVPKRNWFKVSPDPEQWTVVRDKGRIAQLARDIKVDCSLDDAIRVIGAPMGNGTREYAAILYSGGNLKAVADPEDPLKLTVSGVH